MSNYSVHSKSLTKSNMIVPVNRGKIIVQTTFPLRRDKKKQLKNAIQDAMEDSYPIEGLQQKMKKNNPIMGTPVGTLVGYLHAKGWTQKKLSEKAGLTPSIISDIINGRRHIGTVTAKKLGEALGVDYKKFL